MNTTQTIRPVLTLQSFGALFRLGDRVARILIVDGRYWVRSEGSTDSRPVEGLEHAVRVAWCMLAMPQPKLETVAFGGQTYQGSEGMRALARVAETAVMADVVKLYKTLLRARTGRSYSVRGGTGTSSFIRITGIKRDMRGFRMAMDAHADLCAAVGHDVHFQSHLVRPCNGSRGALVFALAGYDRPLDWAVVAPSWD